VGIGEFSLPEPAGAGIKKARTRGRLNFLRLCENTYCALIASVGHTSAHAPQSVQASGSIL